MDNTESPKKLQEKKRKAARANDRTSGDKRNHYCVCGRWGSFGSRGVWRCEDCKEKA